MNYSTNTTSFLSNTSFDYYDSDGDYRNDEVALRLNSSEAPLYSQQSALPALPVPSLSESIATFLPTALPLAETDDEMAALRAATNAFPEQAAVLQERLLQRAAESSSSSSWLQQWWNTQGYLQPRTSNVLRVSYFFRLGRLAAETQPMMTPVERAAAILHGTVSYAASIRNGTKAPDTIGETLLCSAQYKYMFGACRMPGENQDRYRIYNNCSTSTPQHAVVAVRGQFYAVPLTNHNNNNNSGSALSPRTIHDMLMAIIIGENRQESTAAAAAADGCPQLGWLTTLNRDEWWCDYKRLLQNDAMQRALHTLQSGLVLLSLDDTDDDGVARSDRDFAASLWHGGGSSTSTSAAAAGNRWFDKSIQLVVTATDGQLGYIGEHSMADGMPAVDYCQYLRGLTYNDSTTTASVHQAAGTTEPPKPFNIFQAAFQSLSSTDQQHLRERVDSAKASHLRITDRCDLQVLKYAGAGASFLKEAGFSPDAVVQMSMQLAAHTYFDGKTVGTYESAQTRRFRHGRTETTRTVSPHSQAFCQAMFATNRTDPAALLKLLRRACDSHTVYTRKAARGLGCDRHFFGLQNLLLPGEAAPDLFSDPVYLRSKRWLLSTSTLRDTAPGFGPVEAEGFGIGYDIQQDHIILTVTAEQEHKCVEPFTQEIATALDDIKKLIATASAKKPRLQSNL
jgi:carnitine O-acetyltransferase